MLDVRLSKSKLRIVEEHTRHNLLLDDTRVVSEEQVVYSARHRMLYREAQEIRRELKRRGVSYEAMVACTHNDSDTTPTNPFPVPPSLDELGKKTSTVASKQSSAIASQLQNKANWLVGNVSRNRAEEILSGMPTGAFLIRSSAVPQHFALSVK